MKECEKMIHLMDLEELFMKMEICIQDTEKMGKLVEREFSNNTKALNIKVCGKMMK